MSSQPAEVSRRVWISSNPWARRIQTTSARPPLALSTSGYLPPGPEMISVADHSSPRSVRAWTRLGEAGSAAERPAHATVTTPSGLVSRSNDRTEVRAGLTALDVAHTSPSARRATTTRRLPSSPLPNPAGSPVPIVVDDESVGPNLRTGRAELHRRLEHPVAPGTCDPQMCSVVDGGRVKGADASRGVGPQTDVTVAAGIEQLGLWPTTRQPAVAVPTRRLRDLRPRSRRPTSRP